MSQIDILRIILGITAMFLGIGCLWFSNKIGKSTRIQPMNYADEDLYVDNEEDIQNFNAGYSKLVSYLALVLFADGIIILYLNDIRMGGAIAVVLLLAGIIYLMAGYRKLYKLYQVHGK